ncbi:RpnC/YadD family protein [Dolichospermum compactum]|uniref:Rpn family recombination-promoting nuclease/putative transposase n=1 Tax=Dolichospermum compactum NIES-806 TaxID=1973481 RepID=A0A1Z4V0W4_9CYAN|nr:hypothetical protein [Dolichospermum compactum]BAZ85150.1 hypothetical protein NIES806_13500 [Dolichospermum compactum NIES-806]
MGIKADPIFVQMFFNELRAMAHSRQELEAMFGLTEWQQTRFYQEVKEETELETKLKTIPRLLNEGLTVEQIARIFELDIEVVKQAIKQQSSK